ncbi:MAG: TauD/TfdA family dioxygenase, partial [Cyanobacteria bacterium P01_D01_bin.50]
MVELAKTKPRKQADLGDRFVKIAGKRFHYVWLYDHCLCPLCHHPSSFQKIRDLSDRTTFPKPKSLEITDEQLIIDWDEDIPHRSVFPLSWLLSHSYDPSPKQETVREKIFWDRGWLEANPPELPEFGVTSEESWINQLDTLGFTVVRNIEWSKLDTFVSSIGPIYYLAKYGRYATVKAMPNGQDLSLSAEGYGLSPHTDLTFIPTTQIVQLLYCVENQASGGESTVIDGFRVASDFRQDHPQYFEILSQTPVKFWQLYQDWDYYVTNTTPIIKLGETGEITHIFFSHKNLNLNLPFDQVEGFYEAYYAFFRYLKNPAYEYCFRLEPGDCLFVQNFRMLHGRKAFKPGSGSRHLEIAYMDWSYFAG